MKFFTTAKLGPKQSLTPEGYLLCEDVPIARTGEMKYLPHECGLPAGRDGFVRVSRTEDDLFRPETVASFAGKAFTLDHPPNNLSVADHKAYSTGHVMHPRRGEGEQSDWLLCDILVTDKNTIREIRERGVREVSAGYDARFIPSDPPTRGTGRQTGIIGNHVALVPQGRCGTTCAVGDRAVTERRSIMDSIKSLFTSDPEQLAREQFERIVREAATNAVQDAFPQAAGLADRVAALEAQLAATEARAANAETALAEVRGELGQVKATADAARQAADAKPAKEAPAPVADAAPVVAPTAEEWQDAVSRAEVLAPGFRPAVMDAAAEPRAARDALCQVRRGAMVAALGTDAGRASLAPFGVRDAEGVARMTCDAATAAFVGASEIAARDNNNRVVNQNPSPAASGRITNAERNRINAEFWARPGN